MSCYTKLTRNDFTKVLIKEFPNLFVNEDLELDVPNGWHKLIYDCSSLIFHYCKDTNTTYPKFLCLNKIEDSLNIEIDEVYDNIFEFFIDYYNKISIITCTTCGCTSKLDVKEGYCNECV